MFGTLVWHPNRHLIRIRIRYTCTIVCHSHHMKVNSLAQRKSWTARVSCNGEWHDSVSSIVHMKLHTHTHTMSFMYKKARHILCIQIHKWNKINCPCLSLSLIWDMDQHWTIHDYTDEMLQLSWTDPSPWSFLQQPNSERIQAQKLLLSVSFRLASLEATIFFI